MAGNFRIYIYIPDLYRGISLASFIFCENTSVKNILFVILHKGLAILSAAGFTILELIANEASFFNDLFNKPDSKNASTIYKTCFRYMSGVVNDASIFIKLITI